MSLGVGVHSWSNASGTVTSLALGGSEAADTSPLTMTLRESEPETPTL